jgi:hypothetical protein
MPAALTYEQDRSKKAPTAPRISERQRHVKRWSSLEEDRSSWLSHWQELNDYILPRRLRYLQTETNQGTKRNDKIINSTATKAARTLGAGKMAGETSPARPWNRLVVTDPEAKNDPDSLYWTSDTQRVTREAMARSNIYSKLHELWFLQGVFATAAMYIEEDDEDDFRAYIFPLGQYCLASTARGKIDTCYRKFKMTIDQVVREYGIENCSERTVEEFRRGNLDKWIDILHAIEPNVNRQSGKIDNHNMPYLSTTWEVDAPADWDHPLRKSGYEEFPVMVARWDVIGEDVYGSGSPGMDALGDIKAMQVLEKRKAEAVDKTVRPPMKAPISAKAQRLTQLPGDVSYVDETAAGAKFEPTIVIRADSITAAKDAIKEHANRIIETFFANLFLMMLMDDRQQPATAREINERHEEKMLMLGPVVERDEDDVLDPMHDRIIRILYRKGKLLPVPPKLLGKRIKIEYTSVMALAQKLLGTASTERAASFTGSTSAVQPTVLDLLNWDRVMRNYYEKLGLEPEEINTEEVVAQMRQARQQQQEQAQAMQAVQVGADAAKVTSQADLSGDSVLSRLLGAVGGGSAVGRA